VAAELALLLAATVLFLGVQVAIAAWVERRASLRALAAHPATYVLALGAYATSWTFFGAVGSARTQGLGVLAIYLGPTLACLLIPLIWMPLLRVLRERGLATIADLFAFRYASQSVGVLVTIASILGQVPYVAVQIRAMTHAASAIADAPPLTSGAVLCAILGGFAMIFGARHAAASEGHPGLVAAIAFGTLFKLVAILVVGAVALFGVLGGPSALSAWLDAHPEAVRSLHAPLRESSFTTLVLLSAGAVFLLPRQFHLLLTEAPAGDAGERAMRAASWGLPLVLLLLNLPIPILLWAGERVAPSGDADVWVLEIAAESPIVVLLAFLGGVAASSAMVIVSSIAIAGMALNHLVLPLARRATRADPYRALLWQRRALIAVVVALGWLSFVVLERGVPAGRGGTLAEIGLVSFVGAVQLVPGLFGVLVWRRATKRGVSAGLVVGMLLWAIAMVVPVLERAGLVDVAPDLRVWLGVPGVDPVGFAALTSVSANALVLALVSLITRPTPAEARAAAACSRELRVETTVPLPETASAFEAWLAPTLGDEAARRETERARVALGIELDESRPEVLLALRERLLVELTALVGPVVARAALDAGASEDRALPLAARVRLIERQLEDAPPPRGPAAAVEELRRYLRGVLEGLPVGVCVVDSSGEVVLWNAALASITGLRAEEATGRALRELPGGSALAIDVESADVEVELGGRARSLRVGRSSVVADPGGVVLVVEDRTAQRALEARLAHQDRLASIGRLAAGVAHEIGNPLSGILMVARNLQREDEPEDVPERLGMITEQAERIDAIVRGMLSFSRAGERSDARVSIADVVRDAARLVRLRKRAPIDVLAIDPDLAVRGDRTQLVQILVNLLDNACDASPPDRAVRVEVDADDEMLVVRVIDEGDGMPAAVRERAFEPFFTTKDPGEGTGLGLAVVHSLVLAHEGAIALDSTPGGGTRVELRLPAMGQAD
jgi:signal transduction histidine kinase/Na+/proline symporter